MRVAVELGGNSVFIALNDLVKVVRLIVAVSVCISPDIMPHNLVMECISTAGGHMGNNPRTLASVFCCL